jgi:pyruvate dehydrogenase E2 component (dihydrolipoamide acetyltransferase)
MKIELTLPQLGLTQTEGSVSEWLKKPGDPVKKDEIIFIVSTDKVDLEIESPADGVMGEILVEPGVTVVVGTPLAWFEKEGAESPAPSRVQAQSAPAPAAVSAELTEADSPADIAPLPGTPASDTPANDTTANGRESRPATSPRARRLARELGLDISQLHGSGPDGRIIEADVRAASGKSSTAPAPASAAGPAPAGNRRRQIIARRMTESIQTIPAFSVSLEVNAAKLVELYESIGDRVARSAGTKLSYTDLLVKSIALALQDSPDLNAVWTNDAPVPRTSMDLNLAVGTDSGVAAPLMPALESASLAQIATLRAGITKKAREGRLALADLDNGAGSLSNLGMYKVDSFGGIITPGQSFIVSVGRLARRPWVDGDRLTIQPTLHLTLSVDHRLADGVQAAAFLGRIASLIEAPYALLWDTK